VSLHQADDDIDAILLKATRGFEHRVGLTDARTHLARSMHPCRESPMFAHGFAKSHIEELIIYGLLVVIGAIPVVISLVERTVFGVEATLGLLMVCAGILGAIAFAWRGRNHRTT
jgi:hypothetical protein